MTWISQHKLLFLLAIAVIVGGVWYGLSLSGTPEPLLVTTTPDGSTASAQGSDQEIIGTLLALRAVTLSGSVFADPSFMTLEDHGTTIIPEPVGRQNPFAPLGAQNVRLPAGATSTQVFTPRNR